jgi:putative heme-binding domain-containing protein
MRYFIALVILNLTTVELLAQHHHGDDGPKLAPPKVFLDKSPRVVAYQLKRLDNQRLLMVERNTHDKKYVPVYTAILSRVGMTPEFREESVDALVKLNKSSPIAVLLEAIGSFDPEERDQLRAGRQLAKMLLRQPPEELKSQSDALNQTIESDNSLLQSVSAAALIVSGQSESLIANPNATSAFLSAVKLVPDGRVRSELHAPVVRLLTGSDSPDARIAAINALGFINDHQDETFERLAPLAAKSQYRDAAVNALLKVPANQRGKNSSANLLDDLVSHAEQTPADERTSDSFIDAMQLADQLMAKVPAAKAKEYRSRLDAVTVRVVRIKTVEEEMRYDLPYFAVEAGKAVQIVLVNEDMMPHNLVITSPGELKEVAQLGLEVGPRGIDGGLPYVPKSNKVLQATDMVPAHRQARLTFTAPTEPGEYPYVCTFPQHWYRMYGVMVVVEDLDEWRKNPVEPANPIGSNRSFVQAWKVNDLKNGLEAGLKGRSPEIGKRLFVEASCAGCHKMHGEGGVIGPELNDVFKRWKGDRFGVLREILDPSHKVDAKYAMQRVLTVDGQIINGILMKDDDDTVTLMVSPDAKEPTVIVQDDIEQMSPSSTSIMPKALLDQYTKDEIFELLAYLEIK